MSITIYTLTIKIIKLNLVPFVVAILKYGKIEVKFKSLTSLLRG